MNFTNINDPAGVKALLDQLRVSQAWKDAVAPQTQESQSSSPASEQQAAPVAASVNLPQTASSASVATLLSQLQPSTWRSSQPNANNTIIGHSLAPPPAVPPLSSTPSVRNTQDPRTLTFQQALPLIAQLADDPKFVAAITQLKKEQDDLERRLWEDRRDIIRKYEEKVKVATTKAALIGEPGLSKHEANVRIFPFFPVTIYHLTTVL
ncbi:hypothetical protein C0991_008490 [Blastosporella zonata]|nr:hypothetical protein C0991_008490 [Blastosporella zonata]